MTCAPDWRRGDLGHSGPFRGTPFHARTSTATGTPFWYAWGSYHVVDVYTEVAAEVRGFRRTAAIADMSPLNKTLVEGPDSFRLVDLVVTRDLGRLDAGRLLYTPWCNEWGKVVGDGLVLRTAAESFLFSAGPIDRWLAKHADDLDVQISDVTSGTAILALQGPRSRDVLSLASGGADWSDLRFSSWRPGQIGGVEVQVLRTGFTGELGYEIWVAADQSVAVWEAVMESGRPYGLVAAGEHAVDIARVEAGLVLIGADYNPAGVDRRVAHYEVLDERESSPLELGWGRLVDFGKAGFVGQAALAEEVRSGGPPFRLVGIEIDWRQALEAQVGGGLGPNVSPRVRKDALALTVDSRTVGRVTSVTWAPTLSRLVGFGAVERGYAVRGTRINVEWPILEGNEPVVGEVVELPFLKHRRAG